jgi:hypothetical protein
LGFALDVTLLSSREEKKRMINEDGGGFICDTQLCFL